MNKYVVAIYSSHEGNNRMFLVNASTAAEAAKKSLIDHCPKKYRNADYLDWVNGMGDELEGIISAAIQGELVLTTPYRIDSLVILSKVNTKQND